MKYISIILLVWMSIIQVGQDLYVPKNAWISLKAEKVGRFLSSDNDINSPCLMLLI